MIKGGYYIKARCIQDSEIAHTAPHIREIWDWVLKEANHKDTKVCKRGQCVRSYKDIQEGLLWYIGWRKMTYSKDQCEIAMKWLRKRAMITTKKTTRGLIITIVNYDKYQLPANYDNHTQNATITTREPQSCHTINKNDKNVKNEKKEESASFADTNNERLAILLKNLITENIPSFKEPNIVKWASSIDRLCRIDKYTYSQIEYVIRWSQKSDFWQANILSPEKLRKQFFTLIAQIKRDSNKNNITIAE